VQQTIDTLRKDFIEKLQKAATAADIEELKVRFLGRKGPIQDLMKNLRDVPAEDRPGVGKEINTLKEEITSKLDEAAHKLLGQEQTTRLANETIDVTLPGRSRNIGREHLITQAINEIIDIFIEMGFSVQYGPVIDTDYYNFTALNIPEDHPARGMQDTFWVDAEYLLRTHTSNIQARVMESNKPPIRIIAPGKAFRNEEITARSHVFFHQLDGFYIDKDVSFADLISTMRTFLRKLFKQEVEVRYRPSYFPFVEPGMEVDVACMNCKGQGCQLCKHTGWLEILGAGMVHPEVLRNGGIDPDVYSGYAWGMGVERLVLLKYGINDIRTFVQNDMRFLNQF
jgi:phenylalanyl-tRNA synthetase alpha chain